MQSTLPLSLTAKTSVFLAPDVIISSRDRAQQPHTPPSSSPPVRMMLELVLIYLLTVSQSNQDFDIKKKLLSAWEQQDESDAPGEIVYDFFKSDHIRDQEDRKQSDSNEDDIIIMPFFSDEVFTLSDLPEEKNWNFVEIDSSKDLVAMENPKQRKYKTQRFKMKPKIPKPSKKSRNNWNLFKEKFPSFNSKIISNTKKEKRQVPAASQKTPETVLSDPWARVDIKTENNPVINFGSYDEFGRKVQHLSPLSDRLMTGVVTDPLKTGHGRKDDMIWNITINLDQTDSPSRRIKNTGKMQMDSTEGKNDRMNEFSEKLEILYDKLEALKSIKAARSRLSPRPPVGKVPMLDRPIAVIVRQDSQPHSRPALLQTSFNINTKSGDAVKPLKSRNSMLSKLKEKLGFLIPPKIKEMLQKNTDRKMGPLQHQPPPPQLQHPAQQLQAVVEPPVGRRAVNPPWHHNGLPPEIQARINSKKQLSSPSATPTQTEPRKQTRSLLDILLPKLGF